MNMHIVNHLFGKMRKARAISRSYFIDTAFIILEIEELAWFGFIQPVPILFSFFTEISRFKFIGRLFQVSSDPFDIGVGESRRHRFTAVGAAEAIRFFPYFEFHILYNASEAARYIVFNAGKKSPEFAFVFPGFFPEGTEIDGEHFVHGGEDNIRQ